MLLSRLLGCPRLELYLMHKAVLSQKKLEAMRSGIKPAATGEPIQYILGETGFMDYTFKTDSRALIPRPETEILVNMVLNHPSLWQKESPAIVDIGTGSGCIILSIAAAKNNGKYLAIDTSDSALELARENAALMQLSGKVHFINADLADVVDPGSIDAVAANLPYIPSAACDKLSPMVRDHEPRSALDGGPDGLDIIRNIIQDSAFILKNNGVIFLEIGDDQGPKVKNLLEESGFSDITITQDLNKRDRVVSGTLKI
jgi:release factor glutamine methyltransferase